MTWRTRACARHSTPAGTRRPPITADAAGFDVAVITVPTPLRNRSPDLSFVNQRGPRA